MEGQLVCNHKTVADDGRLVCSKIGRGDKEISPALCAACPAAQCNCANLRFSLEKEGYGAVVIRYGNGKSMVWDDRSAALRFSRAACASRTMPVCSVSDCAGCPQRVAILPQAIVAERQAMVAKSQAVASVARPASVGKVIPFPIAANRQVATTL